MSLARTNWKTSKFKVQSSNKLQVSNFKIVWNLIFGVWCLKFVSEGGFG